MCIGPVSLQTMNRADLMASTNVLRSVLPARERAFPEDALTASSARGTSPLLPIMTAGTGSSDASSPKRHAGHHFAFPLAPGAITAYPPAGKVKPGTTACSDPLDGGSGKATS